MENLCSIRQDWEVLGYIEIIDWKIVTTWQIWENEYDDFFDLIKGLRGFNICFDDIYF
jgi:hypothetical protein